MMLSGDKETVINGGLYLLYLWHVRGVSERAVGGVAEWKVTTWHLAQMSLHKSREWLNVQGLKD